MVKRKLNYPNGMIVDLSNIRISNNKYEWDKSVGAKIPFIYNGVEDCFILEDYKKSKITISYKGFLKNYFMQPLFKRRKMWKCYRSISQDSFIKAIFN